MHSSVAHQPTLLHAHNPIFQQGVCPVYDEPTLPRMQHNINLHLVLAFPKADAQ